MTPGVGFVANLGRVVIYLAEQGLALLLQVCGVFTKYFIIKSEAFLGQQYIYICINDVKQLVRQTEVTTILTCKQAGMEP